MWLSCWISNLAAMSDVLAVDAVDLTKTYGALTAVDRLNLQVSQGRCTGSSARTGPARPPSCACCSASFAPTPAPFTCWAVPGSRRRPRPGRRRRLRREPGVLPRPDRSPEPPAARRPRRRSQPDEDRRSPANRGPARPRRDKVGGYSSACASASASPPHCCASRGCWSSTSRPTASTRPACATCAPWSSASPPAA